VFARTRGSAIAVSDCAERAGQSETCTVLALARSYSERIRAPSFSGARTFCSSLETRRAREMEAVRGSCAMPSHLRAATMMAISNSENRFGDCLLVRTSNVQAPDARMPLDRASDGRGPRDRQMPLSEENLCGFQVSTLTVPASRPILISDVSLGFITASSYCCY
jgi:hypothetical protein